ncbi:MAG: nucleotide exchange factor GrpE [Acidobacteriota bacterium]
MNSNARNQEASQAAAEAAQEHEVRVKDKRRFTADGEPIIEAQEQEQAEASTDGVELLQAKLKEAEEKRGEAERKISEFADRFRRAQEQLKAETDEIRARINRASEQKLEVARGDLVAGLLDALDNLKRAVVAAEKSEGREADFDALLEGVKATASLFESKMLGLGLTPVAAEGEDFNPEVHEAVEIVPVDAEQDNKVIAEYQTGYKFGDRLLRPARVRVGRAS